MSKRLVIGSAAVAALVAASACGKKPEKATAAAKVQNPVTEASLTTVTLTPDAVRRLGIQTAKVDSLAALPTRTIGGEIMVPPGLSVTIAAPVAGRMLAPESGAFPPSGSRVSRGAVLMRIAPLPPDLAQAGRDNEIAAARLRQATAEAERSERLFFERLVSARENEVAQAELAAARATATTAAAQNNLVRGGVAGGMATLAIASPSDGIIRMLSAAPGQTVSAGAPLAEVMRTDRLWVRVPVYAGDANRVRRGAPATVHGIAGAGTGTTIAATPVAAPPSADANASTVDLFYELRATGTLRPGERVGVTIPLTEGSVATSERGLAVPLASIVRDMHGGSWVYERTDSVTFVRRRVEVARVSGAYAILSHGPKRGTNVVTAGSAELFGTEFGAGK